GAGRGRGTRALPGRVAAAGACDPSERARQAVLAAAIAGGRFRAGGGRLAARAAAAFAGAVVLLRSRGGGAAFVVPSGVAEVAGAVVARGDQPGDEAAAEGTVHVESGLRGPLTPQPPLPHRGEGEPERSRQEGKRSQG